MAKGPGSKQIWQEYELESLASMLRCCRAFWLFIGFGASLQVRNTSSDSCDIALKTIADLAKIRKSQVTFAAFNSVKISSV